MGRNRHGHNGEDSVLRGAGLGTQVFCRGHCKETLLLDMDRAGKRVRLLKGGNGGFGNTHFKGPVNPKLAVRQPRPGRRGAVDPGYAWKLIADVGLVGLPNAGKSTFLAAASAAKPKIADYPFTTLAPNLGMVDLSVGERFILADIPGLIEGASEGAGLGVRFLGHVERTASLIHLVDGTQEDVVEAWRTVRHELENYGEELGDKTELLVLSKVDALDPATRKAKAAALKKASKAPVRQVSGVSGEGVVELLREAYALVRMRKGEEAADALEASGEAPEDWAP